MRRARAASRGDLPRRQPRPRGPRRPAAEQFSRGAALAAQWTQETISAETLAYLKGLEPTQPRGVRRPVPRQPARSGVGVRALAAAGRAVPRRAAAPRLPDRSLARGAVVLARCRAPRRPARRATATSCWISRQGEWLINPGSVGQPRDGDPRAAWLELDDRGAGRAIYRRTEYDIAGAAAAIRAARLPDSLAERLSFGQ